MRHLNDLTEEDLVTLSVQGNSLATDELLRRFEGYAIAHASRYPVPGMGPEDTAQEILIAIHGAISNYDPLRAIPFAAWAKTVAKARVTDLRRYQGRDKRVALDRAESFDASLNHHGDDSSPTTLADVVPAAGDAYSSADVRADMRAALPLSAAGGDLDALLAIVDREGLDAVVDAFYLEPAERRRQAHLSRSETKIALAYIDQIPASEIAAQLKWSAKKVENARRRVMVKLAKRLHPGD